MQLRFSSLHAMRLREKYLQELQKASFDVLIIGGGINGAVSAAALSVQGLRVALIDKGDFASFTSQESSNLVWGGIKYLENLELGLVRKLCKSRNLLMKEFPSNIQEICFLASIDKHSKYKSFFLYLASLFYWLVGSFYTRAPRYYKKRRLGKEEAAINLEKSCGGFAYSDAFLLEHDARFVFHFIRSALDYGAVVVNYVEALSSVKTQNGEWLTKAQNQNHDHSNAQAGEEIEITSKLIINACGPHADAYNALSKQNTEHKHLFSKGVHLIVPAISKKKRILAFFADDGRPFFVIPLGERSCIGTTDTRLDSLNFHIDAEDRRFILENINKRLRLKTALTERDIISERCGVRPLLIKKQAATKSKGKGDTDWLSLSRKHFIETNRQESYITIYGGKLSDCINIGNEIIEEVRKCGIHGSPQVIKWYGEDKQELKETFLRQASILGLSPLQGGRHKDNPEYSKEYSREYSRAQAERLWRRYGKHAFSILEGIRLDAAMKDIIIKDTDYMRVEYHYAACSEMVVKLEDFLRRRTNIALMQSKEKLLRDPGLEQASSIFFADAGGPKLEEYKKLV